MKTNYHTHTKRCLHAQGLEEDYVQAALGYGVSVLGFSDHAPFPDHDFGYRMPYEELQTYFSAVDRVTTQFQSDIIIKKGLEIEYMPQYEDYYQRLLTKDRLDYLLLGEHFYCDDAGTIYNIYGAESTEAYPIYARAIAKALDTGYFSCVAHPDLFTINSYRWDKNCDEAVDIILEAAARHDAVLEFNANGLRRGIQDYPEGKRYMYPHRKFWEKVPGSGIRVIVGADSHEPNQIWDGMMDKALEVLEELGIQPIETLV